MGQGAGSSAIYPSIHPASEGCHFDGSAGDVPASQGDGESAMQDSADTILASSNKNVKLYKYYEIFSVKNCCVLQGSTMIYFTVQRS